MRGRQQHLFREFVAANSIIGPETVSMVKTAYESYVESNLSLLQPPPPPQDFQRQVEKAYAVVLRGGSLVVGERAGDREAKIKMHINTALSAAKALSEVVPRNDQEQNESFYSMVQDVVLPYLDALKGSSVQGEDYSVFTQLTQKYENRFMEDVRALNVLDPDEITRVTEFVPEIVSFVERIVEHKFAYATPDGSVYFDISAFEAAGNSYARLEPWNRNDSTLQSEGEGSLTDKSVAKRSSADFALWKASKSGEPSWPSPWGNGRPGWHIECSAMASSRLGKQMDIHSGGIDLAFPHHDNELAQSEAYWSDKCSHDQWVNYFLHMGHLSIQGSKMSKSLKNFTTIKESLEKGDWTTRSLRIVFLLGAWKDGIEITDAVVKAGSAWEEKVNNFFLKAKDPATKYAPASEDDTLATTLKSAQDSVHQFLCDSFNTVAAMYTISELITKHNSMDKSKVSAEGSRAVAKWITSMVNIFGLNGSSSPDSDSIGWSGIDIQDDAKPYLYPLSAMRDSLRQAAKNKTLSKEYMASVVEGGSDKVKKEVADYEQQQNKFKDMFTDFCTKVSSVDESDNASKEILALCDQLRDTDLFDSGIYLEDREGQPALVRPVTKDLIQLREAKVARARQKELDKEARQQEALKKAEKGKLSHLIMFRTSDYSEWDEDGVPVKNAQGEEINKSQRKKLRKDWERQKKAHEAYLAIQGAK